MKKLLAVLVDRGGRKASVVILAIAACFANNVTRAETVTKVLKPDNIVVLSNGGVGLAQFYLLSTDFQPGTLTHPWKLQGIDWNTTSYLQSVGERVQLCFYPPFNSVTPVGCDDIQPNSSGTVSTFNDERFGNGTKVIIRHTITGSREPVSRPAGNDTLIFRFNK
ncbi:hypothetical protein [Pseudomonas sp. MWU15-20650]|uniref:hypothetical protein n=1 Tax=Pseudomonas sp. MWU15-20650 TaxID=2933107 RepID=UPI00200DD306|nr:hypothetical protein [Pseudomonas sp. MWU15-20650]